MKEILGPFIEHARQKGMDHATIRLLLLSAGWKEREISTALAAQSLDTPVPAPPDRGGAREAFLHLLTFAALYTTVISLVILFFTLIDRLFPDPARQVWEENELSSIRWQLAALIVSFPVFLGLSWFLLREIERQPEKATSAVRRWLTYLTLLLAALGLACDFVTLVYYFLEGGLSVRFLCKVLVVLLIGGLTFSYYLLSLRRVRVSQP